MTTQLYRTNPYLREADSRVVAHSPAGGVIIEGSIFYPTGGGQPGDSGTIFWNGHSAQVVDARKSGGSDIELVLAKGEAIPGIGDEIRQVLDWERRYRHMRIHTGLHLLSVVIPLPVTGGAIRAEKGRLDFDMPDPLDNRDDIARRLNELVNSNLPVSETWITDEELAANPALVKTMSVKPPVGSGRVRLVKIGDGEDVVDLQPCGGTHVSATAEIGGLRLGKVEKKGRRNRRVNLFLDE